jgi:hypothetical protein
MPTDGKGQRIALLVCGIVAVAGTFGIWQLKSYLDTLTILARTDPAASIALFRTRVLPALIAVALAALVAGGLLVRHGMRLMRGQTVLGERGLAATWSDGSGTPRALGMFFTVIGVFTAAVPLALVAVVLWMLRGE